MISEHWVAVDDAAEAVAGDVAVSEQPLETWELRQEGWVCRSSLLMDSEGLVALSPPEGSTFWRKRAVGGSRDERKPYHGLRRGGGGDASPVKEMNDRLDAALARMGEMGSDLDARARVLDAARQAVTVDRAATHGDLEDSFGLIAALWSADLGIALTACDVARLMALLKVARAKGNPGHQDNWVDLAGYAACGGALAEGRGDG